MSSEPTLTAGGWATSQALYALDWSATRTEQEWGAPGTALRPGALWSWHGEPWRLDAPEAPLRLEGAIGRTALHRVASSRAARFARRPVPMAVGDANVPLPLPFAEQGLLRSSFVVTNGRQAWSVGLAPGGFGVDTLALFLGAPPPRDAPLWIVSVSHGSTLRKTAAHRPRQRKRSAHLPASFGCGTRIETPTGPAPVERLAAGDMVLTDSGPRPLRRVWLIPSAPAVRVPAEVFAPASGSLPLTAGPGTWIGIEGPALSVLFDATEALVQMGDLATVSGVRCRAAVDLIGLELWPQIGSVGLIMADGMPCLGVPVQAADIRPLTAGEAQIAVAHRPARLSPRMAFRGAA